MPFSLKLFLSILFVVSNVLGEDVGQACMDLLDPENRGTHCCESLAASPSFDGAVPTCFASDEITCENFECFMDKLGVMKGHLVDEDAVKKHFEKTVQDLSNDKALVDQLKQGCLDRKFNNYSKDNECPAADLLACIIVNVNLGCTKWKNNDIICSKMAENAKKCKEYMEGAK